MHYEKFQDGTVKCIEDEIPFELPEGWNWARIGTICIVNPKNIISDNLEVSFIPMPLISEGYANTHTHEIRTWNMVKKGFTHFAENDIGIAKITPCFENRKSVIFKNLVNGYGAGTTELHILRTLDNTIVNEYLLWIAKMDSFIQAGVQTFSGAVGQQRVSKDFLVQCLIPIPPQKEQAKIVNKINSIFNFIIAIESEKESLQGIIKQAKSKILDIAIRGQLVPQDPNDEPASVLLERIRAEKEELIKQDKIKRDKKESVIFKGEDNSYYQQTGTLIENLDDWYLEDIPDTWQLCCLGELCDYGNCINVDTKNIADDAWILDLEDIEKDSGRVLRKIRKFEHESTSTKHLFHKGQVLYSKLRPYLNKVVIADEDGFCTSEILPLDFADIVEPQYALYYLMSPTFLKYANRCSYGVKMPRLGTADGKKAVFPLPPLDEQKRIVQHVLSILEKIDIVSNALL